MSLDPQFYEAMNATLILENFTASSSGGWGGRKFGATAYNVRARFEDYIVRVLSKDGNEMVSKGRAYAAPFDTSTSGPITVTFNVGDRITIPAGYIVASDRQPRIISAEQHNDELGSPMYYELLV